MSLCYSAHTHTHTYIYIYIYVYTVLRCLTVMLYANIRRYKGAGSVDFIAHLCVCCFVEKYFLLLLLTVITVLQLMGILVTITQCSIRVKRNCCVLWCFSLHKIDEYMENNRCFYIGVGLCFCHSFRIFNTQV